MTREEAIKILEDGVSTGRLGGTESRIYFPRNICTVEDALDMAIAALREQESLAEKQATSDKASDKASDWISVEERLPNSVDDVLTCRKNGHVEVNYMLVTGKWRYGSVCVNPITHWRPLPEPPKEEEHG